MEKMKTRADFLRAQRGRKFHTAALGVETCATPSALAHAGALRVGFTASAKVGGAVERNLAKRRMREAARALLPLLGREGHDYVLIARAATLTRPFDGLLEDLKKALSALSQDLRNRDKANG
ncbi:MAG: ribonuclease P protein component [Alphaproteobacteria bacterium]